MDMLGNAMQILELLLASAGALGTVVGLIYAWMFFRD
jgi:hypothetical protein